MHLLLVEDDARLAALIRRGLLEEGHTVEVAADGQAGERAATAAAFDVLVVDWRLPLQDGRRLIEKLRGAGVTTPALMLTALSDVEHRVAGLDAGADDYLAKPFAFDELFARVRALGRRALASRHASGVEVGPLRLCPAGMEAYLGEARLELRTKEWQVLVCLAEEVGRTVPRQALAERVWNSPYTTDNVIGVTISGIRTALRAAQKRRAVVEVETVRGVGYQLLVHQAPHASHQAPHAP